MNTEDPARTHLAALKSVLADLSSAQDWDTWHEVMWELQNWVTTEVGHMNARDGGYIVVLDRRVKDEDAAVMQRFLLNISGVIAVDPVPDDPGMHIAERRALYRMQAAIEEAIRD